MKKQINVESAWKKKTSYAVNNKSSSMKVNFNVIKYSLMALGIGSVLYFSPNLYNKSMNLVNEKYSEYQAPKILANASSFGSTCLDKSFTVSGGPGWATRLEQNNSNCLDSSALNQLKISMEASGLAKELDRPGSSLVGIFEIKDIQRVDGSLIKGHYDGKIVLSSNNEQASIEKSFELDISVDQNNDFVVNKINLTK